MSVGWPVGWSLGRLEGVGLFGSLVDRSGPLVCGSIGGSVGCLLVILYIFVGPLVVRQSLIGWCRSLSVHWSVCLSASQWMVSVLVISTPVGWSLGVSLGPRQSIAKQGE